MQQHTSSEIAVVHSAVLPEQPAQRPVPRRIVEQVQQGLDGADSALRALEDDPAADCGDYEISMRSTATCGGETVAEALAKAAAWCRADPNAQVEAIGYRRIEEPLCPDEFRVTLVFSYPDQDDE